MIVLDATTKSLQFLLGGSVTTNQLPFVATYIDYVAATPSYTPGEGDGVSNNGTAVTLVAAPSASTQRQVKFFSIYNADTASAIVTVRYNNNATTRSIVVITLSVGDTMQYDDSEGFRVLDSSGNIKQSSSATVATTSAITDDTSTNATMYPTWVTASSGNLPIKVSSTKITFNPSTATLTTTNFAGLATNATNTAITDDTSTNATMYPTWVTTTSGNLPQKISSTKITFNPSTATLTTTTFSGALSGNASTATSAATLTTTRAIYGNNFDGSAALTQIIASTFGGTGNGFTKFSGPASSEKTFTLPNVSDTVGCLGTIETWTAAQTFNSAKFILAGSGSGTTVINAAAAASGTLTLPAATDTLVGRATTDTISNKRKTPRYVTTASTATLTPEIDTQDLYRVSALAGAITIANHSTSTPTDGEQLRISLLDNGTARAITFGTNYVAKGGIALPTTTTLSKNMEMLFEWNNDLTKWNLLALAQEA